MFTAVSPMTATTRPPSLTDLTDAHGAMLEPWLPLAKPGGPPRAVDRREVSPPSLSRTRTGGPGDLLPPALRPKRPVAASCAPWRQDGLWPRLMAALRAARRRPLAPAPEPTPRAARRARQAVQPTAHGGERGEDGGQPSTGRPRPGSVDRLGRRLALVVRRAASAATVAAPQVLGP
jgi:putative transposase